MVKSRLNTFMLRIGMDDLFQKAFPDTVPYPSNEEVLPEADDGYNNRTTFWSLEYRGALRKEVLRYAFERDLLHPEDCGTMTHWYSRYMESFFHLFDRTASVILDKNHPRHTASVTSWKNRLEKAAPLQKNMKEVVSLIEAMPEESLENSFIMRDVCDLLRTLAAKKLDYDFISASIRWVEGESLCEVKEAFDTCLAEFSLFADILALSNEFSLYHTLEGLKTVSQVNPHFEKAIKDNSVNYYCRSAVFEPVKYVYLPEMELLTRSLLAQSERTLPDLTLEKDEIFRKFINTPLESMRPGPTCLKTVCQDLQKFLKE